MFSCNDLSYIWDDANIAEDLVVRDVDRWKEYFVINPVVVSAVLCTQSYTSSSSSQTQNGDPNHEICEGGADDCREVLLVDTGSVILNPCYIFLKG